jgi:hypothetical protein
MPEQPLSGPAPDRAEKGGPAPDDEPKAPAAPGVLTTLLCEQCGNVNLIRVKGCWYCEKCHYKFDCYGW